MKMYACITSSLLFFLQICTSYDYYLNATGGTFPESVYNEATFSHQFSGASDYVNYFALGSATGKCNIMGYWHVGNVLSTDVTNYDKIRDTLICTDKCIGVFAQICGNRSDIYPRFDRKYRRPLVNFAGSDSLVSEADYKAFPDMHMFPAIAGAVAPIFNVPELRGLSLVLSRKTISLIFLGAVKFWNDSRILNDNTSPQTRQALLSIKSSIIVVVRTDSSGTSEIFSQSLSLFDPSLSTGDSAFANVVGTSPAPKWCGNWTNEIQVN